MFLLTLLALLATSINATNYYVSFRYGSDRNPGTITQPWRSIRPFYSRSYGFLPGDELLMCRGDEFYITTIFPQVGGTAENPLVIGSYKCDVSDELPIISPAIWFTGRNFAVDPATPHLISVNLINEPSLLRGMGAVWSGNERRMPARSPNLVDPRVHTIQSYDEFYMASNSQITAGRIYSANITQGDNYWRGAMVSMRINNWTYQQSRVMSSGPGWIQTDDYPYSGFCSGFWFEAEGRARADLPFSMSPLMRVDAPGEWTLTRLASDIGRFTYWPVDDAERAAILNGTRHITMTYLDSDPSVLLAVDYVTIRDVHLAFAGQGVLNRAARTGITVINTKITNMLTFGVQIGRATNTRVINNIIDDAAGDCIWVDSAGGLISGNRVSNCGMHAGYGFLSGGTNKGISSYQAHVIGNHVTNTGYSGIEPKNGADVSFNYISNVMLSLNDGGGIYLYGSAGNNLILEGNIITNVVGNYLSWTPWNIASCIFTDEGTSMISIFNNTCTAAPQCMQMNRANGNVILSNKCNSPGIYLNNGVTGGGHVVVGNQITTSGTSSTLQNPISRIKSPGATQLTGITAFYLNSYCQQGNDGSYLWQTDFGENGVTRFYNFADWVFSECKNQASCYFEQDSAFYYGNCAERQQSFFGQQNGGRPVYVDTSSSINVTLVAGIVVPISVVLVAIVAVMLYLRSKKQSANERTIDQTLASLPNGMLPSVAPLQVRTSSTSSVDYEQYSSPVDQSFTPQHQHQHQSSPRSSEIELSPQYVLHKTSSAPIASH